MDNGVTIGGGITAAGLGFAYAGNRSTQREVNQIAATTTETVDWLVGELDKFQIGDAKNGISVAAPIPEPPVAISLADSTAGVDEIKKSGGFMAKVRRGVSRAKASPFAEPAGKATGVMVRRVPIPGVGISVGTVADGLKTVGGAAKTTFGVAKAVEHDHAHLAALKSSLVATIPEETSQVLAGVSRVQKSATVFAIGVGLAFTGAATVIGSMLDD